MSSRIKDEARELLTRMHADRSRALSGPEVGHGIVPVGLYEYQGALKLYALLTGRSKEDIDHELFVAENAEGA